MLWKVSNRVLDLSQRALLMGVLNVTPDSFSDGGSWSDPERAIAHGLQMVREGADLIDIGGESTRPGASEVSEEEEWNRVRPVLEGLRAHSPALLSIDTRKPAVARAALQSGASVVNDVGGLQDPAMRRLLAETGAGAIAMHMQGTPATMQHHPSYGDLLAEVRAFFLATLEACAAEGVAAEQILLDPGIGFGKTLQHNLQLLAALDQLPVQNRPLALGVSRKSFLGKILDSPALEDRSWPTVALTSYARSRGVVLLRVHEVLPNAHALRMTEAILNEGAA
ncbi:MAG: dihydropteroate synthase [Verrucomicrobiota bacterium]|jgi:dihydropteroate synthase